MFPCGNPATIGLYVYETDIHLNYTVGQFGAGTHNEFPIPGLSVGLPVIGDAGVFVDLDIEGNADKLTIKLGLDACAVVAGVQVSAVHN